ncbi:MAG TPA: ATP-binding cassette domain-containing protein [Bryobacteraceae bacterium]|nr:ATP-binding cassette domain-containing protein [Bryobacteraceae bacterium]
MASAATSEVLRFDDVNLHFDGTPALDHVSFAMNSGETRVVFGAAGAGKTVLLKTALGLVRPDAGHITLFGEDITRLKESAMYGLRSKVGILFQEGGLFDSLTIAENVAYPLVNQQARGNGRGPEWEEEVDAKVQESLNFVELGNTLEKYPSELSGGMRRRVGIARAIVTGPPLVLYDSPTAGLDPITANLIVHLLIKERDTQGIAAILVTHRYQDGHLMANFRYNPDSGRIEPAREAEGPGGVRTKFFVMNEGRLVFQGSEAELRASQDPYVRKFVK